MHVTGLWRDGATTRTSGGADVVRTWRSGTCAQRPAGGGYDYIDIYRVVYNAHKNVGNHANTRQQ